MGRSGILLIAICAAATSGCVCHGICTKRQNEKCCPTDVRKTHFWCFGEDAVMRGPCGPKEELYGYEPTSWREFPEVAAACYGPTYVEQLNLQPSMPSRLPPLPSVPTEPTPQEFNPPPVDPIKAIEQELPPQPTPPQTVPPQPQAPAGNAAMRPTPFAARTGLELAPTLKPIHDPARAVESTPANTTARRSHVQPTSPSSLPESNLVVTVPPIETRSSLSAPPATAAGPLSELPVWAPVDLPSVTLRGTRGRQDLQSKYAVDSSAFSLIDASDSGTESTLQRIAPTFTR